MVAEPVRRGPVEPAAGAAGRRSSTRDATADELAALERELDAATTGRRTGGTGRTSRRADTFVVLDGEQRRRRSASARVRQASPVRVLNRLVVHPDAGVDPVPVTLAALAGRPGAASVVAAIQGPSPVLRPLLDLGFRIADRDQFMASEPDLFDPARLIPNPGML